MGPTGGYVTHRPRNAQGVTRRGQPFTKLSSGVAGVTKVTLGNCLLQHARRWDIGDPSVMGRPTMYTEENEGLIFWPTPDQTYAIDVYWDGEAPRKRRLPIDGDWLVEYYEELRRAKGNK